MTSTEEEDDSLDDSDVSMTESSDESSEEETVNVNVPSSSQMDPTEGREEEEEDDELVKAIKAAKEKTKEHPPDISFEDLIIDVSFHPDENILGAASITGDVFL